LFVAEGSLFLAEGSSIRGKLSLLLRDFAVDAMIAVPGSLTIYSTLWNKFCSLKIEDNRKVSSEEVYEN
jgi:hypothetical protein